MALVAHISTESFSGDVMSPSSGWEWNVLRDGDLPAGNLVIAMVTTEEGDMPVVAAAEDVRSRSLVHGAELLVQAVTNLTPIAVTMCYNAAQYAAYRTLNDQWGITGKHRGLYLPDDDDAVWDIKG